MTDTLLRQAALWVNVLGILSAALVAQRLRRVRPAVAVLCDFLLAAGLVRLAVEPTWTSLAVAAATAAVRTLLTRGLRPASALGSAERPDMERPDMENG
ncbi:hypothetical protein AB0I39_10260 [Kitasatospora purpeofusca]|uniref:hypothetical protein n=1 Tax=Kitasatospora purpeofusca TaxID=67352 RepID=UPI0033CF9402